MKSLFVDDQTTFDDTREYMSGCHQHQRGMFQQRPIRRQVKWGIPQKGMDAKIS